MNDLINFSNECLDNDYDFNPFNYYGEDIVDFNGDIEDYEDYDDYEECEDDDEFLLGYDKECDESQERGSSWCTFSAESYRHFLHFYNFLRRNGFEKMKICSSKRYTVDVFGLTPEEATLLTNVLLSFGNFVPLHISGQVA